jgi:integrase
MAALPTAVSDMARRKNDAAVQLEDRHDLTAGLIEALKCPAAKAQAFLRDAKAPGLRVRVTTSGAKSYVFEGKLDRRTIRHTIGDVRTWTIPTARVEANRWRELLDRGVDPRELQRQQDAAADAKREADARQVTTVGDAWRAYIAERRPHWSAHHLDDHVKLAQVGGQVRGNRKGVLTTDGPLAAFMPMKLREVDTSAVQAWAASEGPKRPARVRLALRLLKAFLRWAASEPAYGAVADASAASGKKTREAVGKSEKKHGALQKEQLCRWFDSVRGIPNPVIAAYLQCLLLTGRRREQVGMLRWEDVNFRWRTIAMRDKMEGDVVVPLTPYVAHLMAGLPRRNQWVFSAAGAKSGRLVEPSIAHRQACVVAGVPGLTLHDLRRSFATLCEWIEVPAGISAQIQGHAPQGVREQNYIRRPLDLLRLHHDKIEAWILEQASVQFDSTATPAGLRVVT